MNEKKIENVVEKYVEVSKNNGKKFDKINMLLPNFIYDKISKGFDSINQVRMSNGIFISLIVDDYYNYIQKLYNINPLLYEEERLKYARTQINITIIPETMDRIEEIKKLIGTSDKVGVVKNSIEHYINIEKLNNEGDLNDENCKTKS